VIDPTPSQLSTIADDVLIEGLDDWIQASYVVSIAMEVTETSRPVEMRGVALQVLKSLLDSRLMEPGDLAESGFKPWNVALPLAIARIEAAWPPNFAPSLGDVCWLSNTAEGDARGKQALKAKLKDAS
jgi:hypothetical protein